MVRSESKFRPKAKPSKLVSVPLNVTVPDGGQEVAPLPAVIYLERIVFIRTDDVCLAGFRGDDGCIIPCAAEILMDAKAATQDVIAITAIQDIVERISIDRVPSAGSGQIEVARDVGRQKGR